MNPLKRHEAPACFGAPGNHDSLPKARDFVRAAALATLLLVAAPLLAQQTPPTLMAGTRLRVKFDTKVGTDISRVGDGIEVRLIQPAEAQAREVLPVGAILTGRVLAVRKGDTHRKVVPVLRLAFEQVRLPDGRMFPAKASVADLGESESVDSEGAVSTVPSSKGKDAAGVATSAGIGAGIGGIAGGGSGAAKGAAIGGGVAVLGDLITRNAAYWDFTLNRNRKAWLRLDTDLTLPPLPSPVNEKPELQSPSVPAQVAQGATKALANPTPAKPASNSAVYLEPAPKARFHTVDSEALLRNLNKAGIPLTTNQSQADYVLRVSNDRHGFHARLTDRDGNIAWVDSAHTQGGITRGVIRYFREHAAARRTE